MRIKVSDRAQRENLVAFLTAEQDGVVTTVSDDVIEVGFVGSLNVGAQLMETEHRLRAWMSAHPDVVVTVSE